MPPEKDDGPTGMSAWRDFWRVAGVSLSVVVLAGGGAAGGVAIDRRLGTAPLFSLLLLLAGLAVGAWYAYKVFVEMVK